MHNLNVGLLLTEIELMYSYVFYWTFYRFGV